jgi:hypothetical protein
MAAKQLGIRWTIGDVSERGYEALRLSIWGATKVFGPASDYTVCVNSVSLAEARALTGPVPPAVRWLDATATLPTWLRQHLDPSLAQGAAWKLSPLQVFPDRYELSLDNDCILWSLPEAVSTWLDAAAPSVLVAEDVASMLGQFSFLSGDAPRNLGMRGLPPGFDLAAALGRILRDYPLMLSSELDEQGLQLAAISRAHQVHVVSVKEVSICSPFPPHVPWLGRAGAHFCGLNAKRAGWMLDDRPAELYLGEHWDGHRPELYARVSLAFPPQTGARANGT